MNVLTLEEVQKMELEIELSVVAIHNLSKEDLDSLIEKLTLCSDNSKKRIFVYKKTIVEHHIKNNSLTHQI